MKLIAITFLFATASAGAGEQNLVWFGRLATLYQAQLGCRNDVNRLTCLPYMAEAEAIGQVLQAQARPSDPSSGERTYGIVFHQGAVERCTDNWMQSTNGLALLRAGLDLSVTVSEARTLYWVDALLRASEELCHS